MGGSLGVLLKASRVRFLSLVAIFIAATITDGGQNEGGAERGGSLPPYILHSSRESVAHGNMQDFDKKCKIISLV